jgi:hypothetical protein
MKFGLLASLATTAALACGTMVLAQDSPIPQSGDSLSIYKEMDQWTIYSDATRGSCLAERVDSEGNVMQMGLTKDKSAGYVGVFTMAKTDIKKSQPIEIAVDGQLFSGESYGMSSKKLSGDYSGGYVLSNSPDFVDAIANGKELIAFPKKTGAFMVDLTGTKRAIEEIRACTAGLSG